ncbi:hypothetical protein [Streptomyces sp. NPDC060184]|uniref:hypothetical protein n=1 Tax=Streptomyces sp. NPDC060184 TaxID=3347064 RepID=UPI003659CF76
MPAPPPAPHTPPGPFEAPAISVEELSPGERAVALYASAMPDGYRFRQGDGPQVVAWIVQGAARLGLEELYRAAAYARSHRVLRMAHLLTAEQARAHSDRFGSPRRLDRAGAVAAAVAGSGRVPVSGAALARSGRPLVEGACVCGGTGWFDVHFEPLDPAAVVSRNCPAHNPEGRTPHPAGGPVRRRPPTVSGGGPSYWWG